MFSCTCCKGEKLGADQVALVEVGPTFAGSDGAETAAADQPATPSLVAASEGASTPNWGPGVTPAPAVGGPPSPTAGGGGAQPNPEKQAALAGEGFLFEVVIEKKPPEKVTLGVDLDFRDRVTLEIEKINVGLIAEWNAAKPDKEVKLGDKVISVNGISGDAVKMIQACKENDVVKMSIRRPVKKA